MSTAPLKIYLLRKMVMCSILILPTVYVRKHSTSVQISLQEFTYWFADVQKYSVTSHFWCRCVNVFCTIFTAAIVAKRERIWVSWFVIHRIGFVHLQWKIWECITVVLCLQLLSLSFERQYLYLSCTFLINNFADCLHWRIATLQTAKEIFFENPYDLLFKISCRSSSKIIIILYK